MRGCQVGPARRPAATSVPLAPAETGQKCKLNRSGGCLPLDRFRRAASASRCGSSEALARKSGLLMHTTTPLASKFVAGDLTGLFTSLYNTSFYNPFVVI